MIWSVVIVVVCLGLAVGGGVWCYKKKEMNKNREVSIENMPMTEARPTPIGVPLTSVVEGNVTLPTIEDFERLAQHHEKLEVRVTTYQGQRYTKKGCFNLHDNVLPFDHNRVILNNPIDECDYINATWLSQVSEEGDYDQLIYTSYIPYFNIRFIVAQDPMSNTFPHHYQMMHENAVDILSLIHI